MSSKQTAIAAHGIYKRFKTGRTHIEVLKRVDFDAAHGEVTMVMGPSGYAKAGETAFGDAAYHREKIARLIL